MLVWDKCGNAIGLKLLAHEGGLDVVGKTSDGDELMFSVIRHEAYQPTRNAIWRQAIHPSIFGGTFSLSN